MSTTDFTKFTANFNQADIPKLYADWSWLIDEKYLGEAWLMSTFGDLFFKAPDGSIHFLDTLEGTIIPFAENKERAAEKLADEAVQKRYLTSETVTLLEERGLTLKDNELYIYVPHPIVAGAVVIDSIQIMSMNVVISLGGQLLRQMRK